MSVYAAGSVSVSLIPAPCPLPTTTAQPGAQP